MIRMSRLVRTAIILMLSAGLLFTAVGCGNTPTGSSSEEPAVSDNGTSVESAASEVDSDIVSGVSASSDQTSMEGTSMTPSSSTTQASSAAKPASSSQKTTSAAGKNRTVTYNGTLGSAVTAKATFTGKSATPNFTEDQKKQQKAAGNALIEDIRLAAQDATVSKYVIPAGNYGFNMTKSINGVPSGAVLSNIVRPDDNPFTIEANGVTFWFEQTGKPCSDCSRALHILNSTNVRIDGLTIDGYTPCDIEGKIVQIDKAGNRLGLKLYEGTMALDTLTIEKATKGSEFRAIILKANGELMAPFYNINNGWGPESLLGSGLEVDSSGILWFTFKTRTLMDTVFKNEWTSFYGSNGTLETGDQVFILYGTVLSVGLDNCGKCQILNLNDYITKGSFWENGGYGAHLWKNCYFGPRPGTNRLFGGEGNMSQGLRHGSTYDGIVFGCTSDDAINIHGFWSKITKSETADGGGYAFSINYAPVGIAAGDKADFYTSSGKKVATCTVKTDPAPNYNYNGFLNSKIVFKEAPPSNYADLLIRWPASECDGFTIRNCCFFNDYQRVLINSGSGVIENNTFINHGSNLALTNNTSAYEGGIMKNIIIRNNVFFNTANHPGGITVPISQTTNWANYVSAENISLVDNIFVNCGKMLTASNIKNLTVTGNLIVNPMLYGTTVTKFSDLVTISKGSGSVKAYSGNAAYVVSGTAAGGDNEIKSTTAEKASQAAAICADKTQSASAMAKKLRELFK